MIWADILKIKIKVDMGVLRTALQNWSVNHKGTYSAREIINDIAEEVARGSAYKHGQKHNIEGWEGAIGHFRIKMEDPSYLMGSGMASALKELGYINMFQRTRGEEVRAWKFRGRK